MAQRVFVDSNVLASRTLRDWLFLLRNETGMMFQVHTTFDVLIEAVRVFRRRHPDADGRATKDLFDHLQNNVDEVLGDFPGNVDFDGADRHDLHVHAATLACRADKLLTANTRDFPESDDLPYEVYAPDDFFLLVDDSAPSRVMSVTRTQAQYWQRRRDMGHTVKALDDALIDAGCIAFAERVHKHLRTLSGV